MKIQIYVTQRDIDQGIARSCYACPVARAVDRRLKRRYSSVIGPFDATINSSEGASRRHFIQLPTNAQSFIHAFDSPSSWFRASAQPFRFTLNLPKRVLKASR